MTAGPPPLGPLDNAGDREAARSAAYDTSHVAVDDAVAVTPVTLLIVPAGDSSVVRPGMTAGNRA
ncbi:hypothetical protein VAB18032_21635 [Micromonospora maris AB-18-032]|uniref:Uncharacterized protein n=1 Tax=Micromonospora maris TaxID=1003110 RepID=A0A9X0I0X4_9ACTN|nr:hypothetical protein VAB18032_21635 [Micromonospora maris AB-18-032]KUJ44810.1 hypothetical protein ADL17_16840 [Micromonospora maris]